MLREGRDCVITALGAMVPEALAAADRLAAEHQIEATVVDLFTLVPLDVSTVARVLEPSGRLFTVEENPRLCGWGAELSSIVCEDYFGLLRGPVRRITAPHIPLAAAAPLEDAARPDAARVVAAVTGSLNR